VLTLREDSRYKRPRRLVVSMKGGAKNMELFVWAAIVSLVVSGVVLFLLDRLYEML